MSKEITLMKGNEAIAHAAIRYGTDGYFLSYNPQSEVLRHSWNKHLVIQQVWLYCKPKVKWQ